MPLLLGIDTGGTFTDAVLFDDERGIVASAKALTTRADLALGIAAALDAVLAEGGAAPGDITLVSLSTTLATNALVEGQGGRVALVLIGFDAGARSRAGVEQALADGPCIEVGGGHDAHGRARAALDDGALAAAVRALDGQVSAYAVAAQFAVRNPAHEIAARDLIRATTGCPVTCSHELSSRLDGPRRAMTCVLNARLIGLIHALIGAARSLLAARGIDARLMVVRGDGALVSAEMAEVKPIETILSGPAASLVGAAWLAGVDTALVADIGGTTTDHAMLERGRPRLDAAGATVGGFRTMVEAVAMRTVGLGGDSEVRVLPAGLGSALVLGPRRCIPLALFAVSHPALVHDTLRRQAMSERRAEWTARFAVAVGVDGAHLAALGQGEREVLDGLARGPVAVEVLTRAQARAASLDRLIARGLVQVAAATPTDAAHVLGTHTAWDVDAARAGLALLAQRRDARGLALAPDAQACARMITDTLVERSAHALLEGALHDDGHTAGGLAARLLELGAAATPLVAVSAGLRVPVVALGASAGLYYPRVAARLGSTAVVPPHAAVANAVGAVVGRVRVSARATITAPGQGEFLLFVDAAPRRYTDLDSAVADAWPLLDASARQGALEAGAQDLHVAHSREDTTALVEGSVTLVESVLVATATGRPRFARAGTRDDGALVRGPSAH